jgi:phosphonate transport system substrate-binding protein
VRKFIFIFQVLLMGVLLSLPARTFSKQVVSFGLCPKYNPRIMYQFYQPFVDYLSENTSYRFEIKLSRSYQETIDRFGRGEVLIASCGPVPYIKAKEKYGVKPILRALNKDGNPFYLGIIIVRKDSPIQRLSDLKGKSFAFGQVLSTAGHIVPQYHLVKAGVHSRDLKHYSFLRHHDSVVQAVLKGQFDAGAVKDVVAYKYEQEGLRFIFVTDPIPTVLITARSDAPKELVESVRVALLKLHPKDPVHQRMMASWDEEFKYGFTQASDSDYDPIRKILRTMNLDREMKGKVKD